MCNDSTYWLAFSLLIVGSGSFILGRFFERADRWLQDYYAERRAVKAALASRNAIGSIPRKEAVTRPSATRRGLAVVGQRFATDGAEGSLWR